MLNQYFTETWDRGYCNFEKYSDAFERLPKVAWSLPQDLSALYTAISRKVGKLHATVPKGIVGGFELTVLQRNLKEVAQKAMEMCLQVLKESNRSFFDSYSGQE